MAFTAAEIENLINFYQAESCLWDITSDDYTDLDKRTEALGRIAQKLVDKYSRGM